MRSDKRASVSPGGSGPAGREIEELLARQDAVQAMLGVLNDIGGGHPWNYNVITEAAEDALDAALSRLDEDRAAGRAEDAKLKAEVDEAIADMDRVDTEGWVRLDDVVAFLRASSHRIFDCGGNPAEMVLAEFSGAPEGRNDG